jgi:hypothetical protein
MAKVIKLTETKLKEIIQKMISEVAPEPVLGRWFLMGHFLFGEGQTAPTYLNGYKIGPGSSKRIIEQIKQKISSDGTLQAMERFYDSEKFHIPKFIKISVGTSHSAGPSENAKVAQGRANYLMGLVENALRELGIREDVIKSFIMADTDAKYTPSTKDTKFYDASKVNPNAFERFGKIEINQVQIRGNDTNQLQGVQKSLNKASSVFNSFMGDLVDAKTISDSISQLETYSDIQDLDKMLDAQGKWSGLEDFLNDQLSNYPRTLSHVAAYLDQCAQASQKQSGTVRMVGNQISINTTVR